ncbi:MAG: ArgR family transcriptional regulator [Ruminococcus sp.]|nr:ArgR family transcriptional regulator [Ruminococcus sp.]
MKKDRHALILRLIAENEVRTQDDLQKLLLMQGVEVTQATLSRDIHELKLTKQHIGGKFRYVRPGAPAVTDGIIREAVLDADHAGHMAVIHCRPGMAQAACAALDAMRKSEIVGTIAGDDTIFVLMRAEQQAADLAAQFKAGSPGEMERD